MKREDVALQDQWDLEPLYENVDTWNEEFREEFQEGRAPRLKKLEESKGNIAKTPESLAEFLQSYFDIQRKLEKLATYAHLKHDEDVANEEFKKIESMSKSLLYAFAEATSWVEPELLSLPPERFKELTESPALKKFRFHLEKIYRMKPHTLSKEEEKLIALAGKPLETSSRTFSSLTNADFIFDQVEDSKGNLLELTQGNYQKYIRSPDRTLRRNAFKTIHGHFGKFQNTLAELVSGVVEKHEFHAKARSFNNSLEAALFPNNISPKVYTSLIETVNKRLPELHRYIALRRRVLDIGPLHLYDMYVPLVKNIDMTFSYQEAEDLVIESAKPLGNPYQKMLSDGLKKERWVDRYENKNKRTGAYSSGCFDSHPYILMNYKETVKDLYTLAHEAGHSMHSQLSKITQNYHESSYPIFLAEVASTFNEELLTNTLIKNLSSKEEKIYLLHEKIEDIRGTLFRQTMFAEFELLIHELAQKKIPLTPGLLNEEYQALNKKYFGPDVILEEEGKFEWARIPHFYYNFYVYQYATGISAAIALSEKVQNGGVKEQEGYLEFLKSGSSAYPLDILLKAGVDMSKSTPIDLAIDHFSSLVQEMEALLDEHALKG